MTNSGINTLAFFMKILKLAVNVLSRDTKVGTVDSTSDNTLWTLFPSYLKDISANIELHSVTC
jgi:hypothetical protein